MKNNTYPMEDLQTSNSQVDQQITTLLVKLSTEAGLKIDWLQTTEQLEEAEKKGLFSLYKEVFAEPPYEEKFDDQEVLEVLSEIIRTGGFLFTAQRADALGKIIAFVGSIPLNNKPEIAEAVDDYVDIKTSSYFAEDAVDRSLRQRGISRNMKKALIEANQIAGFDTIVLRTSSLNLKQIAAVTKSGGRAIAGVFQDVQQARQDGSMKTDRRGFYVFKKDEAEWSGTTLERVTIARPGGNETAFVWDQVPREQQGDVSKLVQAQSSIIEQVMFVERQADGTLHGQMAGGEFCGNATRSFGYLLLDGKDGVIDVSVSGASTKMRVEVKDGQARTQIPVKPDLSSVTCINNYDDYIVHLDGISFLVTSPESPFGQSVMDVMEDKDKRDARVKAILGEMDLIGKPASGIMVTYDREGTKCCEPFVYVRDTGTLYYESGCGSGSTSVGMVEAIKSGNSIEGLSITQPSGLPLIVTINRDANGFASAFVNGPVEILSDEAMPLPNSVFRPHTARHEI